VEASTARAAVGDLLPGDAVAQLPWRSSLAEGLREAQRAGKPVFIDFTGYTCVNCRWMEKRIFAERSVYEVLRDRFVLVRLYTDGGPDGEANQNLEIQRFGTVALPYYVILAPDNTALAKHAGIVPTAPEFLKFLSQGWYPERCCIRAKTG
jgi:thiol:disulfide interchange protein DsbD